MLKYCLVGPFIRLNIVFLLSKGYSGLFIGNEYTKEKTNEEIHKLTKPNVNNLLNGNYLFNSI